MNAKTVRIVTGEWSPYISEGFAEGGVSCHIVREAFARMGYTVEYTFTMPWIERIYELAKAGDFDATMAWRATPVRLEHFVSSAEPVMENRYVFFHRRDDDFDWRRFEDLAGIPIAGTRGFNYGDRFRAEDAAGRLDVRYSDTTKASFEKLLAGEVRLVAHDQGVGHEDLRTHFSPAERARITFHPRMTDHHLSNVIFPRVQLARSVLLRDAFDRGLEAITRTGEVARQVEDFKRGRYGNAPFEGDYWTLSNPLVAEDAPVTSSPARAGS
ncbi:MAG: ABC transporter substrate-binding protein [Myxococcota bacterium]